ncbi:hypothetical protein FRC00_009790, partial [Tulasnella sp. 408]
RSASSVPDVLADEFRFRGITLFAFVDDGKIDLALVPDPEAYCNKAKNDIKA